MSDIDPLRIEVERQSQNERALDIFAKGLGCESVDLRAELEVVRQYSGSPAQRRDLLASVLLNDMQKPSAERRLTSAVTLDQRDLLTTNPGSKTSPADAFIIALIGAAAEAHAGSDRGTTETERQKRTDKWLQVYEAMSKLLFPEEIFAAAEINTAELRYQRAHDELSEIDPDEAYDEYITRQGLYWLALRIGAEDKEAPGVAYTLYEQLRKNWGDTIATASLLRDALIEPNRSKIPLSGVSVNSRMRKQWRVVTDPETKEPTVLIKNSLLQFEDHDGAVEFMTALVKGLHVRYGKEHSTTKVGQSTDKVLEYMLHVVNPYGFSASETPLPII